MNMRYALCLGLCLTTQSLFAGDATSRIIDRGPHHRTWFISRPGVEADGTPSVITNQFTEIATGMHYEKNGQWVESEEKIDLAPEGAVADRGQLQVTFAANLNSEGAVKLITPDNKTLRSHVLGLAYYDSQQGDAVWIAFVKDRTGAILGDNQVIYEDAFTDIKADVRYTYTRNGLEQDVILRQNDLPDPAAFGFNREATRLEVITEFVQPPVPAVTQFIIETERNPVLRQGRSKPRPHG